MAKRWKCARCSTENEEGVLTCSNCRMIRGGVVVPGSFSQHVERPEPGWPTAAEPQPTSQPGMLPETSPNAGVDPATALTSKPFWRRPLRLVTITLFVVLFGLGALASQQRSSGGAITHPVNITASDLRVGDCFDLKDPAADEIDDVNAGPCTDEHKYEMFFVGAMPEGPFPAKDVFDAFTASSCTDAFEAYIGKTYEDSELEFYVLTPSKLGWLAGDHLVQCAAYHPRNPRLTNSVKGSGQ